MMMKQVMHAGVLMTEFLSHTVSVVAGAQPFSPWLAGTCGIGLVATMIAAVHAARNALLLDGNTDPE